MRCNQNKKKLLEKSTVRKAKLLYKFEEKKKKTCGKFGRDVIFSNDTLKTKSKIPHKPLYLPTSKTTFPLILWGLPETI